MEIAPLLARSNRVNGKPRPGADVAADENVRFFQPVRDMLNVGGPVLGLDGFFHRDDVHTDACAARGHHGGDVLQRQERHPLKEGCHLGVVGDLPLVHVEKLCAAGHEHRQDVLLFAAGILPVVLQQILCCCSVLFSAPFPLGLRP